MSTLEALANLLDNHDSKQCEINREMAHCSLAPCPPCATCDLASQVRHHAAELAEDVPGCDAPNGRVQTYGGDWVDAPDGPN